ncbi:MAG TPA: hypothetical protein VNA69_17495 [Thermoanaerobaculia bacterium]|nr:hypothetical protein [Thermoanaerobaculia bacterium]
MSSNGNAQSLTATAVRVAGLVTNQRLRDALERSFSRAAASVEEVERCFELLPAKRWSEDFLSTFLHSWKATHLKMLAIYGLSCRIQRLALTNDGEAREQLWIAAARNAETSYEDLGLDYEGVTHAALYDDMARSFVPNDAWLMEENGLPAALEFKRWVYEKMVVGDIPTGLLTNMFSEIYNHAEYSLALRAFTEYVDSHYDFTEAEKERALCYIGAHVGDETELRHFLVVVDALNRYNLARRLPIDYERAEILFTEYLERLGVVMGEMRLRMVSEQQGAL